MVVSCAHVCACVHVHVWTRHLTPNPIVLLRQHRIQFCCLKRPGAGANIALLLGYLKLITQSTNSLQPWSPVCTDPGKPVAGVTYGESRRFGEVVRWERECCTLDPINQMDPIHHCVQWWGVELGCCMSFGAVNPTSTTSRIVPDFFWCLDLLICCLLPAYAQRPVELVLLERACHAGKHKLVVLGYMSDSSILSFPFPCQCSGAKIITPVSYAGEGDSRVSPLSKF